MSDKSDHDEIDQDRSADEVAELVEQKQVSTAAIGYVLRRVRDDERLRYYLGAGTETFEVLAKAYSKLIGRPASEVFESIIPGSAALHCGDDN